MEETGRGGVGRSQPVNQQGATERPGSADFGNSREKSPPGESGKSLRDENKEKNPKAFRTKEQINHKGGSTKPAASPPLEHGRPGDDGRELQTMRDVRCPRIPRRWVSRGRKDGCRYSGSLPGDIPEEGASG